MRIQSILKALPIGIVAGLIAYSLKNSAIEKTPITQVNSDIPANLKEYEVLPNSIHDGDTLRVRSPELNTVLKIRFACIDAPELKQPMGEESRNYLRSLINKGNGRVRVQPIVVDRYGRTVAQLWNSNGLVQSQMVVAGMAYGYQQYKKDCPSWEAIESTEVQAQKFKVGLWKLPNGGERPWNYRKAKR